MHSFFQKLFTPNKNESKRHRTPRPSTGGTAIARTKSLPPNGREPPPKETGAIVPRTERRHRDATSPLPEPPGSISSATTTHPACFAPLQEIGAFRPRTATSTKENERPATSHAGTTSQSFAHHGAEASYVNSKPASADSKSPRPRNLDDDVHPALRNKVQSKDQNVYGCTDGRTRTEYSGFHEHLRSDQQPQSEENSRRKAVDMSVLFTQGRKHNEPSSPPSSQAQHSPPARVVCDTSSSPHRDQQPCQWEIKDQQRAADMIKSPTHRHDLHEPRPQTTKPSRSGRDSDTTTLLSNTEWEAATSSTPVHDLDDHRPQLPPRPQTTGELDLKTLYRLWVDFRVRPVDFDWCIDDHALRLAKRCTRGLDESNQTVFIDAAKLLKTGRPSEGTAGVEDAKKAWSLLSLDDSHLRIRHITEGFCKYFFHLYVTLRYDEKISYQVPVNIWAKIDTRYHNARNKLKDAKDPKNRNLVIWIGSLDGEKQGISLIALLELRMYSEGSLKSRELLRAILNVTGDAKTLRHVSEDQISNFFVTQVRAFYTNLKDVG